MRTATAWIVANACAVVLFVVNVATFPNAEDFDPAFAVFVPAFLLPIILAFTLVRTKLWWLGGGASCALGCLSLLGVSIAGPRALLGALVYTAFGATLWLATRAVRRAPILPRARVHVP